MNAQVSPQDTALPEVPPGRAVPTTDIAIEARGLVKRFGNTTALDGVDLIARRGTVLGLLGPNGAGKTTAVRILATLLRPDAGHARASAATTCRRDAHQVRQLIGLTGQYASVDEGLSGLNNLVMIGRLLGHPARAGPGPGGRAARRFGLADAADRPGEDLLRRHAPRGWTWPPAWSAGRGCSSSTSRPPGLDPRSRIELWNMVRGLTADGATVLLTTQYLEEADHLCHDITVIDHGTVIASGTPAELKARVSGQVLAVTPADPSRAADIAALISQRTGLTPASSPDSGAVTVQVTDASVVPTLVRDLDDNGIAVEELALRKPSLDEVFLSLTGSSQ